MVPRDPFPTLEAPGSDPSVELVLVNGANLVYCYLYFGLRQNYLGSPSSLQSGFLSVRSEPPFLPKVRLRLPLPSSSVAQLGSARGACLPLFE